MYFQENETQTAIRDLYQQDDKLVHFMDEFVYGKTMKYYNTFTGIRNKITLHLHAVTPEILIGTRQEGFSFVFNLRKARLDRVDLVLQQKYDLKANLAILLEEDADELFLVFNKKVEKEQFCEKFKLLCEFMRKIPSEFDSSILKSFIKADTNRNMSLSRTEILKLFKEINIDDGTQINNIMGALDFYENGEELDINFRDFEKIMRFMQCRRQFLEIFKRYTNFKLVSRESLFNNVMTKEQFTNFLQEQQKQSKQYIRKIIQKLYKSDQGYFRSRISFYQFCQYLMSSINSAKNQEYKDYPTDTSLPLYSYYCNSSHNTYLTGNQLTSDSHEERYYEDLCNGIRCVEVDCHNSAKGPIVTHGYTATSSIFFHKVIEQINKFSEENPNHTPIVISLQNHCNNENQAKMARTIKTILKNKVIEMEKFKKYPTLADLAGRMIVRGTGNVEIYKKMMELNEGEEDQTAYLEDREIDSEEEDQKLGLSKQVMNSLSNFFQGFMVDSKIKSQSIRGREIDRKYSIRKGLFEDKIKDLQKQKQKFQSSKESFDSFVELNFSEINQKKKVKVLNYLLLKLTSMLNSGTMNLCDASPWESVSLCENKVKDLYYSNKRDQILSCAEKSWIRVYPLGVRFDSSNYDPLTALEFGAQIIALNTQNIDYYTHIMKAFFSKGQNKTAGYRLKPSVLPQPEFETKLSITPISASNIYYNDRKRKFQIPPVQVKMKYFGVNRDIERNYHYCEWRSYTEQITNNAYNPIFKQTSMMNLRITSQELGFIVMEITDCGIAVLPIDNIRKGYRSVTLYDNEYEPKDSKIICLFE